MRIETITCWRPRADVVDRFAAPPYDVFDRNSARTYVAEHPTSFLAIDRPETAFGEGQDIYAPEVYAKAAELLAARKADGTLMEDEAPCLFAYRLSADGRSQVGVVAACAVENDLDGTVRRHELTLEAKVRDRVRHTEALGAQPGPVLLAYRDRVALDELVARACEAEPVYDFEDASGVRHTVWCISDPAATAALCAEFAQVDAAYIADGHHRAEAATRICAARRAARGEAAPRAAYESFLALLFPAAQLSVYPYDRVVADSNGLGKDELLAAIGAAGFSITPMAACELPAARGRFAMRAFGTWFALAFTESTEGMDAVASLDVSLLQSRVLAPLLGIDDPQTSSRVRYVGGNVSAAELEEMAGEDGVAFALCATSVADLMAVADAGGIMPPKSTWFAPKPLSGLFVRSI